MLNIIAKSKKKRSFYENLNLLERYDLSRVYGMSIVYVCIQFDRMKCNYEITYTIM